MTARSHPARLCPNRESPVARDLWRTVAAGYSNALDTLGVGSRFASDRRTVPSEREVGPIEADQLTGSAPDAADEGEGYAGVGFSAGSLRWAPRFARLGYAQRIQGPSPLSDFGAWFYPLDDIPQHLVSPAFGGLHSLSLLTRDERGAAIAFCPARGALPGRTRIEGILYLSADGRLEEARYRFLTPDPSEHAGAEIVFAPARAPDGRPLPLPGSELFWRRPLGGRGYYQRYREYHLWELGPDASLRLPPARRH